MELAGSTLEAALQYSPTPGLPSLVAHLHRLQEAEHGATDRQICVTTGSADGLSKAFDMLLDADDALRARQTTAAPHLRPSCPSPNPGPHACAVVESPTFSGSLAYLQPIGCKLVGVACDDGGLSPDALHETLSGWDESREGCRRPRVLYTVPTGANPTGASLDVGRRRRIYEVAREFNLIILEDDPYHWLQFADARTPSLLSMDEDGRVLRFDSFSKLLCSGIRLGWATGPAELVERLQLHTQASNLHTCGVSQALVAALFDGWAAKNGGDAVAGFSARMREVATFYREQRDAFVASAERHLTGLAHWGVPTAGMFVWIDLLGIDDAHALIAEHAVSAKVLLIPGSSFMPCGSPSSHVRAAFSTATPEQIDEALKRLAGLLRQARE